MLCTCSTRLLLDLTSIADRLQRHDSQPEASLLGDCWAGRAADAAWVMHVQAAGVLCCQDVGDIIRRCSWVQEGPAQEKELRLLDRITGVCGPPAACCMRSYECPRMHGVCRTRQ